MSKISTMKCLIFLMIWGCAAPAKQTNNTSTPVQHEIPQAPGPQAPIAQTIHPGLPDSLASMKAGSLLDLPVSQLGEIILASGLYQADFKSYCLQPGTPDPTSRDAYVYSNLAGPRKEILETALRNSIDKPYLDQNNIQLLLWSVVSGSNFDQLHPEVKRTARVLLTPKQIFQLKGGVMGVVSTVATVLPDNDFSNGLGQMRNLFELGQQSYEAYERIAVLRTPSVIHRANYPRDQWHKHPDGYYLRYFPSGYQLVHVEVFVPEGLLDSTGLKDGRYLLFDPVRTMAIPANSNAQRLGIGAPVVEVIRKVIEIQRDAGPRPPVHKPTPPADPKVIVKGDPGK
jgi:hypothetical protein